MALLQDAQRVNTNLRRRAYEFYIARHAPNGRPPRRSPPVAQAAPGAHASIAAGRVRFRCAAARARTCSSRRRDSIPPVNIMTAEPTGEPETTGTSPRPPAAPPRRPAQASPQPKQATADVQAGPIDLNAAARSGPPAAVQ